MPNHFEDLQKTEILSYKPMIRSDLFWRLYSALSCWWMAWLFLASWWWPLKIEEGHFVRTAIGILILEFIVIHSGGMAAHLITVRHRLSKPIPKYADLGLLALYSIYGIGIVIAFKSWYLFWGFTSLLICRAQNIFGKTDLSDLAYMNRRVGISAFLFLVLTFATVFIRVPSGGLDPHLLDQVWPDRKSGIWELYPQSALAMGFIYFLVLGLVELQKPSDRWLKNAQGEKIELKLE